MNKTLLILFWFYCWVSIVVFVVYTIIVTLHFFNKKERGRGEMKLLGFGLVWFFVASI